MTKQLTVKNVENAKPGVNKKGELARKEYPDGGTQGITGLYLVVQPSGNLSWAFRYRFPKGKGGKAKKLTLGGFPRLSLAEARTEARKADTELRSGRDPAAPKLPAPGEKTVEDVARDFLERHAMANTRPKSYREVGRILGFTVYADDSLTLSGNGIVRAWQGRALESITGADVIDLTDSIAVKAPVSANRALSVIKTLFGWAVSRKLLTASPAAGIRPPSREKPRQRVLRPEELRAVWKGAAALEGMEWAEGAAYRLLILTGQRKSQVSSARFEHFDLETGLWTIPAEGEGNKTGFTHVLPITREIEAIVRACPHRHGFLFSTDYGATPILMGDVLKRKLDKIIAADGVKLERWTNHDLRRTMRSGISALAVPEGDLTRELVIGHVRPGVSGIYDTHKYLPEKKICLELWAGRVRAIVEGNVVVPIRAVAAA
jgi:integrase